MNGLRHLRSQPWALLVVVIGLVAGHLIFLDFLWHAGVSRAAMSGVVVSGLILLVIAKHLGLVAALLGSLYTRFRRRS